MKRRTFNRPQTMLKISQIYKASGKLQRNSVCPLQYLINYLLTKLHHTPLYYLTFGLGLKGMKKEIIFVYYFT